ncbi:MAG: hypothetical protein QHH15_02435 [Candidatus Thermoplasmatota archaeon]|nr:hypothetical protein [Candidatus Thermoplasmatota archaeon]
MKEGRNIQMLGNEDYEHEDEAHDWKDKPPVLTIVKRGRSTPRVRYKVMKKKTFSTFYWKNFNS